MRGASRLDAFSVYPFRTWLLCHAVGRQQIHQWSVHPGPLVLRTAPLNTTKLQNALKGVNGQIKSTQSQLKDVNKLLKLDPGNTELLAQKHKLLAEAVSETKEKLATLKTAAEQANTALANGEISKEQYDALQREIVETEQDLKNLETQANQSATAV